MINHLLSFRLSLPAVLLSASLLAGPPVADAPALAPRTFTGTLVVNGSAGYRLDLDEPEGGLLALPLDEAGEILAGKRPTNSKEPFLVDQRVCVSGRLVEGRLRVDSLSPLDEVIGWLSTTALHAARRDPATFRKVDLLPGGAETPEYGLAVPGADETLGFLPFDSAGQTQAAKAARKVSESGGLRLLAGGILAKGKLTTVRILHERNIPGHVVTADFVAAEKPLREITREYLLAPEHAATGYGYVVNSCGGYEFFPFDKASHPLVRKIVLGSDKAARIKVDVRGFYFWHGRTVKVIALTESREADAKPVQVDVQGLLASRGMYLKHKLQTKAKAGSLPREELLAPAEASTGYGIVYKPCCRFGFYRTDEAGQALLSGLLKRSAASENVKVIAHGVVDLDFIKLASVEEDAGDKAPVRHPLKGRIVEVHPAAGTMLVKHQEIPGFMMAMTMLFHADAATVTAAHPGEDIEGVLVQRGEEFWLEDLKPAKP